MNQNPSKPDGRGPSTSGCVFEQPVELPADSTVETLRHLLPVPIIAWAGAHLFDVCPVGLVVPLWVFLRLGMPLLLIAFAVQFVRHYTHHATAAPCPPETAGRYRRTLGVRIALVGLFMPLLLPWAVGCCLVYLPSLWRAWVLWFNYGRSGVGGGVFTSPAGSQPWRVWSFRLLIVLFGASMLVLPDVSLPAFSLTELPRMAVPLFAVLLFYSSGLMACGLASLLLGPFLPRLESLRTGGGLFERVLSLRSSPNVTERGSVWLGSRYDDDRPVLYPIDALMEHFLLFGSPGSGKTRNMCGLLKQIVARGSHSVIILDLKGDSVELMSAARSVADKLGLPVKVLHWYDRKGFSSYVLNVFTQSFWQELSPLHKAALISNALTSSHGLSGYGPSWFGGAAFEVLLYLFEHHADEIKSFRDLERLLIELVGSKKRHDIPQAVREAAMQVWLDARRLAQIEPLNATDPASIDLCSVYTTPQVLYVRLHSALSFDVAGGVGRLWLAALFAAGAHVERKIKALLFLDEFQRIVGEGVELLFQQARSCDIGLVLSTQSRASLQTRDYDFSDVVTKYVRCTWSFDIADPEEQQIFSETSGKVIDQEISYTSGWGPFGWEKQSRTRSLVWADRIPLNEVKFASAHAHLSFLYVVRDGGFINWGAMPEIVHTPFLQSKDEYERERTAAWPPPSDETILVTHAPPPRKTPPADGGDDDEPPPVEVIGRPRPPKPYPQPRRRNQ